MLDPSFFDVGLNHYLTLSAALFSIGLVGVLVRRNTVVILMCIELMLNAINISFVAFGRYQASNDGNVMVFFVMAIAAAEAAVGLALIVAIYKRFKKVDIKSFEGLRG